MNPHQNTGELDRSKCIVEHRELKESSPVSKTLFCQRISTQRRNEINSVIRIGCWAG